MQSSNCSAVPNTHIAPNAAVYMYGFSEIISVGEVSFNDKSIIIPAKITPDPKIAHDRAHVSRFRYIAPSIAKIADPAMIGQL